MSNSSNITPNKANGPDLANQLEQANNHQKKSEFGREDGKRESKASTRSSGKVVVAPPAAASAGCSRSDHNSAHDIIASEKEILSKANLRRSAQTSTATESAEAVNFKYAKQQQVVDAKIVLQRLREEESTVNDSRRNVILYTKDSSEPFPEDSSKLSNQITNAIQRIPSDSRSFNTSMSSLPGAFPVGDHSQSQTGADSSSSQAMLSLEEGLQRSGSLAISDAQNPDSLTHLRMSSRSVTDGETDGDHDDDGRLVEANPVVSELYSIGELPTAEAVENEDMENQRTKEEVSRKQSRCIMIGGALVAAACLCLATLLGVFLGPKASSTVLPPTLAPSISPSKAPSNAPSEFMLQGLPDSTLDKLSNISTPQWKAFDWLSQHPDLPLMPEWRRTQLFALGVFYHSFEGPNWRDVVRERWMLYDQSECLWFSSEYGNFRDKDRPRFYNVDRQFNVEPCNGQGEMQTLVLDDLELEGQQPVIPPEIALLTSLAYLALRRNGVETLLVDYVPSEIYQMTNLTLLALNNNKKLSGTLPTELGLLTKLEYLELDDNSHSGSLPTELGLLTLMKKLVVHRNKKLKGIIPTQLGRMTNMIDLGLNQNKLTGPIPSQFGLMTGMEFLQLAKNSFFGTIPTQLGSWTAMVDFRAQINQFTGTLPTELGLMTLLDRLNCGRNKMRGKIPTEFGQFSHLEQFFLTNVTLSGSIPSELGLLANVSRLYLDGNDLTGTIPTELGLLTTMERHKLNGNNLYGPIPSQYGLLTHLEMATFHQNNLNGMIPSELSLLAINNGSLQLLRLGDNNLSGTIADGLCLMGQYNSTLDDAEIPGLQDDDARAGLQFACGVMLCGCNWCDCNNSTAGAANSSLGE